MELDVYQKTLITGIKWIFPSSSLSSTLAAPRLDTIGIPISCLLNCRHVFFVAVLIIVLLPGRFLSRWWWMKQYASTDRNEVWSKWMKLDNHQISWVYHHDHHNMYSNVQQSWFTSIFIFMFVFILLVLFRFIFIFIFIIIIVIIIIIIIVVPYHSGLVIISHHDSSLFDRCLSLSSSVCHLIIIPLVLFMFTLQGTNISPKNGILKMIFLFPRWDMLVPWRVVSPIKSILRFLDRHFGTHQCHDCSAMMSGMSA